MKIRGVIMLLAVVSASSLLATSMSNPISLMFSLFIGIDRSDYLSIVMQVLKISQSQVMVMV
jgi:hypothetical protein